jgi:predicted ArsR family transcriptional regulator
MSHAVAKGQQARRKILNFLTSSSQIYTIRELGNILDISQNSVRVHTSHLAYLGLITEQRLYPPERHKKGVIAYGGTRQKI